MTHATADYVRENEAARADLRRVVAGLSDADLAHPTHSGWTVAATLAHLAYWDRRYRLILERWERGDIATAEEPDWADDLTNDSLLPEWLALPRREACRLALEAADAVDTLVASLSPDTVAGVMEARRRWLLHRHGHRREHLAEIERALGPR